MNSMNEKSPAPSYGISYIRFSDQSQKDGSSETRQRKGYEDFCARFGLIPWHESYIDRGASAFKGHHKQGDFGRFLAALESGKFPQGSVLVVEALDRYSRENPIQAAALLQQIARAGIRIGVVTKGRIFTADDFNEIGPIVEMIVDLCATTVTAKSYKREFRPHGWKSGARGNKVRGQPTSAA